jgi:hypothetical protein
MRSAFLALLLCLPLWTPPVLQAAQDSDRRGPSTYAERSEAEKTSRSRYRDLEVASLVLIIVVGGAAILWAVRKK